MAKEQNEDTPFVEGMSFRKPHQNAPSFIKGNISVKIQKFIPYAKEHANADGWLNIDLKKSKAGNYYLALNTYTGKGKGGKKKEERDQDDDGLFNQDENADVNAALSEAAGQEEIPF